MKGSPMAHIRLSDMRPRFFFHLGDQVGVDGTALTGMIINIDPDGRLACVNTRAGEKWFYLKDLRKLG